MKIIKRITIFIWNLLIGYISLWWMVVTLSISSYIYNEAIVDLSIIIGIFSLILLLVIITGGNLLFHKNNKFSIKTLIIFVIIPFAIGLTSSVISSSFNNI